MGVKVTKMSSEFDGKEDEFILMFKAEFHHGYIERWFLCGVANRYVQYQFSSLYRKLIRLKKYPLKKSKSRYHLTGAQ